MLRVNTICILFLGYPGVRFSKDSKTSPAGDKKKGTNCAVHDSHVQVTLDSTY